MSIFTNPFFSIAGQTERIKNVGSTLNAAFNPFAKVKGVTSNTGNVTADKILSTVASHPYVSAGIVAGGVTAIKNPAQVYNVVKNLVTPKTTVGKVAALVSTPVLLGGAMQVVKNKPTETLNAVISTPNKLFQAGQDLTNLATEPSMDKGIQFVKDHPYFTSGALLTGLVALGFTTGSALSIISNYQNTKATQENTEAREKDKDSSTGNPIPNIGGGTGSTFVYNILPPEVPVVPSSVNSAVAAPPTTTTEGAPAVVKTTTKKKATKKKPKKKATKKKPKKKATKKKTRRSKKKPKKKSINRRKSR